MFVPKRVPKRKGLESRKLFSGIQIGKAELSGVRRFSPLHAVNDKPVIRACLVLSFPKLTNKIIVIIFICVRYLYNIAKAAEPYYFVFCVLGVSFL